MALRARAAAGRRVARGAGHALAATWWGCGPSSVIDTIERWASVGISLGEMWEWRRSRINRAAHDLPANRGASQFPPGFLHPASESAPVGRWAALLRSEAGPGHARSLRVTRPRLRAELRKRREGGAHRYAVACVPITVGITVPITVGVEVVVWGTDPGTSQGTKK